MKARADLAAEMGRNSGAEMGEAEKAKNDGAMIRSSGILKDLIADDKGVIDITSPVNKPFVTAFLNNLPDSERAGLRSANGEISPAGIRRVKSALLGAAFDDNHVIARLTESTDDNIKNVGNAILQAAPQLAEYRSLIDSGQAHGSLDITKDIADAANVLSHLRATGDTVKGYLAQEKLFGDPLSPTANDVLAAFDKYKRSPNKLADVLRSYVDSAKSAGSPDTGGLFGGEDLGTAKGSQERFNQAVSNYERKNPSAPEPPEVVKPPRTNSGTTKPRPDKLISAERVQASKDALKAMGLRLNTGLDPTAIYHLGVIGADHLENGIRAFPKWIAKMREDTGLPLKNAGENNRIYSTAYTLLRKTVSDAQQKILSPLLQEQLGGMFKNKAAAAQFVKDIADADDHNPDPKRTNTE